MYVPHHFHSLGTLEYLLLPNLPCTYFLEGHLPEFGPIKHEHKWSKPFPNWSINIFHKIFQLSSCGILSGHTSHSMCSSRHGNCLGLCVTTCMRSWVGATSPTWGRNKPHFIKPIGVLGLLVTTYYRSNQRTKWENKIYLFYKSICFEAIIQVLLVAVIDSL